MHRQQVLQRLSFDFETKTGEPNRVSGVLIGSSNTQRKRVQSYWISEHVYLSMYLDFLREHDSVHR